MNFKGRVTVDDDEIRKIVAHHISQQMRLPIDITQIQMYMLEHTSDRTEPKYEAFIDIDTDTGLGVAQQGGIK